MQQVSDHWPQAVLFDLDGTLIDSLPDIAAATNQLLSYNGLASISEDAVRKMIGNGVRTLVERAFAHHARTLTEQELDAYFAQMMEIYSDNLVRLTKPYHGTEDTLRALISQDKKLAVVTNKPEAFSLEILEHFGWGKLIDSIIGGDTLATRKPEPDMLFEACHQLGVSPQDAVMVGDGPADIDAAKNGKIKSIAIRGGYTNVPVDALGADIVVERISDVPAALSDHCCQINRS